MRSKVNRKMLREGGQLSIFLGVSLLVVMTFIAFVVNVGMFVKGKINLQNAVDAAAWSGAAVQARQLTNIGYMNWELRNTYKEWLFKYYVLGNMAVDNLRSPAIDSATRTNFRLQPFYTDSSDENYDPNVFDRFNVPTICIHYGSPHNICGIAMVPGLPRFNSVGLPSISEHHESFLNSIVKEKAEDCSARTNVNFGAAMLWAYGTRNKSLFPGIPEIAGHRTGGWPEAIEVALRIRNLEMIVNFPPIPGPICAETGETSGGNCTTVEAIESQTPGFPLPERSVKAFWSAFRNLGGGFSKREGANQNILSRSFTLTELAPEPLDAAPTSLSGFLIPEKPIGQSGTTALQKSYLDLQPYTVNLVNFYTTFVSDSGSFKNSGTAVGDEARCAGSKTALPIPGYIMGFVKNPEVMTYYAVKGEARFVGLFFPFSETNGIKMSAYAAAKPFGGKIGPRLFSFSPEGTTVIPRQEANNHRTAPYVSGFNTSLLLAGGWKPIYPLPLSDQFWVDATRHIGGTPKSGAEVYFGIPNIVYDFESIGEIAPMNSGAAIEVLQPATSMGDANNPNESFGLYDARQYRAFRANLRPPSGPVLTPEEIDLSLNGVRKPTRYEAMNYMIPTVGTFGEDNIDTLQVVNDINASGSGLTVYQLFAPLHGQFTLFQDIAEITNVIVDYIAANKKAVDAYLGALEEVANDMRAKSATTRGGDAYKEAANTIHKAADMSLSGAPTDPQCQKLSMAGIFNQFFNGQSEACGITPLTETLITYLSDRNAQESSFQNFYVKAYTKNDQLSNADLMAAYMPGTRQGAQEDGTMVRPFPGTGNPPISRRNYYSTKFFAIEKIMSGGNFPFEQTSLYLDTKEMGNPPTDISTSIIRNKIEASQLAEFGSDPAH